MLIRMSSSPLMQVHFSLRVLRLIAPVLRLVMLLVSRGISRVRQGKRGLVHETNSIDP